MKRCPRLLVLAAACLGLAPPVAAQRISLQDNFRIGSGGTILCTAESSLTDPALEGMFDRAYALICRDAAVPVGRFYALRTKGAEARLAAIRAEHMQCQPSEPARLDDLAGAEQVACTYKDADLAYRAYALRSGDTLYVAEGLQGYDSALRLGLRTLVADRPVPGELEIATTGAGDPAAFARAQAGVLDPQRALAEAYRRNNAGSYAESAEFFGALVGGAPEGLSAGEVALNNALQQSNLANYAEANRQFARAEGLAGEDPVLARMLRNYLAIHLMNQARLTRASAELERPMPPLDEVVASVRRLVIDARAADRLSAESPFVRQLGAAADALTPEERAQILDGQAEHLRGTVLALRGEADAATAHLRRALDDLSAVRGGRVTSTIWMRAQILGELAAITEAQKDGSGAERLYRDAVALLAVDYPASAALASAQGRLAGYYARAGRADEASALFRQIVTANAANGSSSPALRRVLAPYFELLARRDDPAAVAELFEASQVLVRPGVAQTQAVLARELSGGSDDAARLFRQSVSLSRDIERARVDIARLGALGSPTVEESARLQARRADLTRLEFDQAATQSKLAEFPRYRVISGQIMTLPELQAALRPGEAYYKMVVAGDAAYAFLATPAAARAFRIGASPAELEREVDAVRSTIAVVEAGQVVTYPFDLETAHLLFRQLFGPVAGELASVRHLVFEPDGAMLRLPPTLLVSDERGIAAYQARASRSDDDGFDFTGISWLARGRDVSTAVSARGFRDVRSAAPSRASADYIGFGENAAPAGIQAAAASSRGASAAASDCAWSAYEWSRPISAAELLTARSALASRGEARAEIVTGPAFTDTEIVRRGDLSQYRIMHFATHGLITPPGPECAARPALLTSFGPEGSDGLLSFSEIYDLRLDADLVILSACDTAGKAGATATREAGLTTGGDTALDGLVRAFVGAGGRSVVASHWPVPDDYQATERLISGLFTAPPGSSTASALRQAQAGLMDQAATSHPYYWAGFAIIGDGAAALAPAG